MSKLQYIKTKLSFWVTFAISVALAFASMAGTTRAMAGAEASGTLVIVTSFPPSLFEKFRTEFEKRNPKVKVFVRSKKTSAAISFIEERINEPADLFWASAPDAFEVLKESGHLRQAFSRNEIEGARIGSYPIDDPDGFYKGFAVSGYGIVWHTDYLKRQGLTPPGKWRDLTNPAFNRHIGISAPSRSGTTHLIVESILQSQGWEEGWATLLEIGGNLATVTARSFGVIDGVLSERFGIGAAIDFLGLSARATGAPVDFVYPDGTAFLPANIGIVKRSANPTAARTFVDFILSEQGQLLLFDPEISRLPVMRSVYTQAPHSYANPFSDELVDKGIAFDTELSRLRYQLVNSMFDLMITFRLQALRRTWKAIHDAELALGNRKEPNLRKSLNEARRLASLVPVTVMESASPTFSSEFVRHKPGLSVPNRQARLEEQWAAFARDHQERAQKLASEVLEKLRSANGKGGQ